MLLCDVQHHDLLVGRSAQPVGPVGLQQLGQSDQQLPVDPAHHWGGTDVEASVLLCVDAHMVSGDGGGRRRRAVLEPVAQVFVLDDLAELLCAPVVDQELHPGLVAQPSVAVVAERLGDRVPDLGGLLLRDEGAQTFGQPGVGGQAAAHPDVVAGAVLGVVDADQTEVVDLVDHILAGVAGDGGLVLAGKVGERVVADVALRDLLDHRGGVDDLIGGDSGDRGAQDDARSVAAGLGGAESDRLETAPDLRDVLHADPVQLDVLPVGDIGSVAGVVAGELADRPQLLSGQRAAVDPHPQHEVLVVHLFRRQRGVSTGRHAGAALGVEAPPAEAPAEIVLLDGGEALLGVDLLDALADVEAVVRLFELLVVVQRIRPVDLPLAVGALGRTGRTLGCGVGGLGGCE